MTTKLIWLRDGTKDKIIEILKNEKLKPLPEQNAFDRLDFMIMVFNYSEAEVRNRTWRKGMAKYYRDVYLVLDDLIAQGKVEQIQQGRKYYYSWVAPIN